jgi:hypothetical protein
MGMAREDQRFLAMSDDEDYEYDVIDEEGLDVDGEFEDEDYDEDGGDDFDDSAYRDEEEEY